MLGIPPGEVVTGTSREGAPRARGPRGALAVSVTHTTGLVAVAASPGAKLVGVDVERLDRKSRPLAISERHFTRDEAAALRRLPPTLRSEAFLRAWTLKEAWGKAVGFGVPAALPRVGFEAAALAAAGPGVTGRRACWPPGSGAAAEAGWTFWTAGVGSGHTLGIAALAPDRPLALAVRALPTGGAAGPFGRSPGPAVLAGRPAVPA